MTKIHNERPDPGILNVTPGTTLKRNNLKRNQILNLTKHRFKKFMLLVICASIRHFIFYSKFANNTFANPFEFEISTLSM